ncbi:MAG TPA: transporter substrate-binding domain-containing protein [Burkholderiaceae bacterium]
MGGAAVFTSYTRSMNKRFVCVVTGLIAGAGSSALEAACGPYQVAYYETGSLYFKNEAGEFVGIDRDLIEELARRTGCVLVPSLESRVRTWAALAEGRLDMTVSGIETPARQQFATFVPYVLNNRNYLVVRNELAATIKTMHTFRMLKSLRLGVVKGFVHGATLDPWVAALKLEGRVDEVADLEVLARVFAAGRVDAFLTQPVVWGPLLKRNQLDGKVQMLDIAPQDRAVLGLVLSRQRVAPADAEKMRKAIATMRADGTLEAIFARYLGSSVSRTLAARSDLP